MTASSPRGGRPIVVAIVALVVAAVLASTVVLFVVTYSGPPPMQMPTGLEEIANRLTGRTGAQAARRMPGTGPGFGPGARPGMNFGSPFGPGRPPRSRAFGDLFAMDRTHLVVTASAAAPLAGALEARLPAIEKRLAALIGTDPTRVIALSDRQPPFLQQDITGSFTVAWRVPGGWRIVQPGPRPLLTAWHKATLLAMVIAVLALVLPAWIIARAVTRPLRKLAVAAEAARAGAVRPSFPRGGPSEVRALTKAVATMHDRLAQHAEGRTAMLAAIAHDLGTPLARLSFWVEQMPDESRERAVRDIDEMRAMISDTLAFARDEAGERDSSLVDLESLIDALVDDMQVAGTATTFVKDDFVEPGPRAVVRGDPRSLRRAIANLIGNAVRYGDRATVRWSIDGAHAVIAIEDDGPGIDPAQAEHLFEPFVRGETSRNRATGGTGLGLAIVRSIAARHGGGVSLANRPGGGGIATLTLPLVR